MKFQKRGKKMRKKILGISLLTFLLIGCGNNSSKTESFDIGEHTTPITENVYENEIINDNTNNNLVAEQEKLPTVSEEIIQIIPDNHSFYVKGEVISLPCTVKELLDVTGWELKEEEKITLDVKDKKSVELHDLKDPNAEDYKTGMVDICVWNNNESALAIEDCVVYEVRQSTILDSNYYDNTIVFYKGLRVGDSLTKEDLFGKIDDKPFHINEEYENNEVLSEAYYEWAEVLPSGILTSNSFLVGIDDNTVKYIETTYYNAE